MPIDGTEERLRLLHAFLVASRVDLGAERVVRAVADDGPAVVLALLDDVELVAALRAVLGLPERARRRVEARGLAGCGGRSSRSRATRRRDRRTDCLAGRCRRRSSAGSCPGGCRGSAPDGLRDSDPSRRPGAREQTRHPVADRHEQMALAVERDARAEVARRVVPRLGFEDLLRVDELVALELGACQRGRALDAGRRASGLIRRCRASARRSVPFRGFA